ncbi:ASCH domain-containing protein [Lactococcus lactis subsp. lactis]|uniref:ASCH domain-containing protein n=1 Tax=Lactococcus lactis TaxID=1358 RepID=UPI00223ABFCD|nr:ASCH domain-containing protein [Lactococcus lactis]MCT0016210.1 ASCH domain-containing protein [Lactococcus lactis subsp. lactis]
MTYEDFIKEAGLVRGNFRWAWAFCNEVDGPITEPELADKLLDLVLEGKKSATASAVAEYGEDEPFPSVDGKFDILLDGKGQPRAAITTSKVYVRNFFDVSAEHAFKEGEGDQSLDYWRKVHQDFWSDLKVYSPNMEVLCEEFEVLYQN